MAFVNRGKIYPPVDFKHASTCYGIEDVEWERIVDRMGRNPNDMECAIFSMLWSESYCNKSSASILESIDREYNNVVKITGSRVGLVKISENEYIVSRIIANNEQSYIDTYYGSQACLDMALTELTAVGAKPLAVLNLLRFGSADQIQNQKLLQGAVKGISNYCNKFGIPCIGGELFFHKQYNMGTMVNCAVLGILKTDFALKREKPAFGSPLLYIGAKTGRDGMPIAKKGTDTSLIENTKSRKTLKNGDPLLAERLILACAEAISKGLLRDVVSAGVGGLGTACFDIAARINNPIKVDIDRIPLKVEGFNPKEILLSETSERLLAIATKGEHRKLIDVFHKWDIDSTVVGQVADADGMEFNWNHYQAADIPFQFALGGSTQKYYEVVKFPPMLRRNDSQESAEAIRKRKRKVQDEWSIVRDSTEGKDIHTGEINRSSNLEDTWLDLLADPNLCSRRPIFKLFDQNVGLSSVVPAGADSAVLRLKDHTETKRAIAISLDANSLYVGMEPYLGTVQTIAEGMRNLAASGAKPIAISSCLNFGNPANYKEVCDLSESIRGLGDATKIWEIPILSQFISLFNGTDAYPTLPTPAIMSIGLIPDANKVRSITFKNKGDKIFLIGTTLNEIGCSEYGSYCHHQVNRLVPDINFDLEKRTCDLICKLIDEELLQSAHDISSGGVAIALSECCMATDKPLGATLNLEHTFDPKEFRPDSMLFSETSARFLISIKPENEERIKEICLEHKIPITAEGVVGGRDLSFTGAVDCSIPLPTAYKIWTKRLHTLLGSASVD